LNRRPSGYEPDGRILAGRRITETIHNYPEFNRIIQKPPPEASSESGGFHHSAKIMDICHFALTDIIDQFSFFLSLLQM
jgi:hypothetical protein